MKFDEREKRLDELKKYFVANFFSFRFVSVICPIQKT